MYINPEDVIAVISKYDKLRYKTAQARDCFTREFFCVESIISYACNCIK